MRQPIWKPKPPTTGQPKDEFTQPQLFPRTEYRYMAGDDGRRLYGELYEASDGSVWEDVGWDAGGVIWRQIVEPRVAWLPLSGEEYDPEWAERFTHG